MMMMMTADMLRLGGISISPALYQCDICIYRNVSLIYLVQVAGVEAVVLPQLLKNLLHLSSSRIPLFVVDMTLDKGGIAIHSV